MATYGNSIMGFFGGGASGGGGGGTSTGINGLNGTTNIGLGGTLSSNTTIAGGGFSFLMNNLSSYTIDSLSGTNSSEIKATPTQVSFFVADSTPLSTTSYFKIEKDRLYTTFRTTISGLDIDFDERKYKFGDFGGIGKNFALYIDDNNERIYTTTNNGESGFSIRNSELYFGSTSGSNLLGLYVNITTNSIAFQTATTTDNGLKLFFGSQVYQFGGLGGNGNVIEIKDTENTIDVQTQSFKLTGAGLETDTEPSGGVKYLVVNLNGTDIVITARKPF
jgi:hypothetical protein